MSWREVGVLRTCVALLAGAGLWLNACGKPASVVSPTAMKAWSCRRPMPSMTRSVRASQSPTEATRASSPVASIARIPSTITRKRRLTAFLYSTFSVRSSRTVRGMCGLRHLILLFEVMMQIGIEP